MSSTTNNTQEYNEPIEDATTLPETNVSTLPNAGSVLGKRCHWCKTTLSRGGWTEDDFASLSDTQLGQLHWMLKDALQDLKDGNWSEEEEEECEDSETDSVDYPSEEEDTDEEATPPKWLRDVPDSNGQYNLRPVYNRDEYWN